MTENNFNQNGDLISNKFHYLPNTILYIFLIWLLNIHSIQILYVYLLPLNFEYSLLTDFFPKTIIKMFIFLAL